MHTRARDGRCHRCRIMFHDSGGRTGCRRPRADDLVRAAGRPSHTRWPDGPPTSLPRRRRTNTTPSSGPAAPRPPGHCSTRSVIARVACASPCQVLVPGVHSPRPKRRSDDGQTILNTALKCWETASGLGKLVELRGLEPLASCMPWGITQVDQPKRPQRRPPAKGLTSADRAQAAPPRSRAHERYCSAHAALLKHGR